MLTSHSLTPYRIPNPNRIGSKRFPTTVGIDISIGSNKKNKDPVRVRVSSSMVSNSISESVETMDGFVEVANKMAAAASDVIRKYFRQSFDVLDKDDLSSVTIADRDAEESMISIIMENFPSHAIFGEENGWRNKESSADYVWVLDPIDGTKSFITGKPLFGTLIALLCKGKPIVGVIDQPILRKDGLEQVEEEPP